MELSLGEGDEVPGGVISVAALALPPGSAVIRQPMRLGSYSLKIDPKTKKREFINSDFAVKYLHCPTHLFQRAYFDLNHGYDPEIKWGYSDESVKIDEMLKWINLHRAKFLVETQPEAISLHTDFVCFRGVLTKIMCTPYEQQEGWMLCATKFQGTVYICQFKLIDDSQIEPDDYFNRMSFSGYRFEKYITGTKRDDPPDPFDADLNFDEYSAVIRTRIGSHSIVYGAEVDCTDVHTRPPDHPKPAPGAMDHFVEIKTTRECATDRQVESFWKFKSHKWWAQSYLAGIPKIICGYRNDKLIVNSVVEIPVDYLASQGQLFWSPQVCINFLNRFLSHVKSCVREDDPEVVYQFVFQPKESDKVTCRRLRPNERFKIIPYWYIKDFYEFKAEVVRQNAVEPRFSP